METLRKNVKYQPHSPLFADLRAQVDAYFESNGLDRTGGSSMISKALVVMAWFCTSYLLLILWASTWWQVALLTLSTGVAVAAIGFSIQHDGGHRAFGKGKFANFMAASALDLMGGSSYFWRHKHAFLHHHYTNITGLDSDINAQPFLRMADTQPHYWWHRFQHWYAWPLYGFLPAKWFFFDDFRSLVRGKIGPEPVSRPNAKETAWMFFGKAVFFTYVFVVPALLGHSLWMIALIYGAACLVVGICLATVFQLAHCVEEAHFESSPDGKSRMTYPWAEHQLATTVNFAPNNPIVTWWVGGLNFQVEHHLFPNICHIHYPEVSKIVRRVCKKHGVPHLSHDTLLGVFKSHLAYMKRVGRAGERLALIPEPSIAGLE